jgi:hypothetical protein
VLEVAVAAICEAAAGATAPAAGLRMYSTESRAGTVTVIVT